MNVEVMTVSYGPLWIGEPTDLTWRMWMSILVVTGGVIVFTKLYAKFTCGRFKISQSLKGIGECVARELVRNGATVYIGGRNGNKGAELESELNGDNNVEGSIHFERVDMASLTSVRQFAAQLPSPIHLLICNAGLGGIMKKEITEDGFEMTMASNYFGHYLLTRLLIPKMDAKCRIVNVSSIGHRFASIDIDDLNFEKSPYNSIVAYNRSKLANVMFTKSLAKHLHSTSITTNSLHPGAVATNLFRYIPPVIQAIIKVLFIPFFKTSMEGAESVLYVALSSELNGVSGQYFWDNNLATVNPQVLDSQLCDKLWQASEILTGFVD